MAVWTTLFIIVATVTTLVSGVAVFVWWRYSYWRRLGIPYLPPTFPFGNAKDALLGRRPFAHVMHDLHEKLSERFSAEFGVIVPFSTTSGSPFAGIYMCLKPSLYLMNLEIIKDVMVRCALSNFQHHVAEPDPKRDPILAKNVFMARGKHWRTVRTGLSPAFSSGKIKMMYPLLVEKGRQLTDKIAETASQPDSRADMKLNFARFTTDVIASCAFGIETNSLQNPENEFLKMGLKIFERSFRHLMDTMVVFQFPSLIKVTRSIFIVQEVADFFRHLVWTVIKDKEEKGIKRGDYLDLLIQLKNKGKIQAEGEENTGAQEEDKAMRESNYFDGDDLVAHAFVFYFAGYETSSTAMNFALFELAANQDCQEKLMKEIDSTLAANGGEITYDVLHSMRYLDMVVSETLRKYPTVAVLDRVCTEEYRNPEFNLIIPKGMHILIPVYSIHRNRLYFPDPEKFDPERFTMEAKKNRPNYCYMPFGEGPRICIGMRFGLMLVKIGIVSVLSKFHFHLPEEFQQMTSPPFDKRSFLVTAEDDLKLIVRSRKPTSSKLPTSVGND